MRYETLLLSFSMALQSNPINKFIRYTTINDSNALSNWEYKNNPYLVVLMVLFSSLMVVYSMNCLIGLLCNAIEKDNNRVSYLIQKAKVFYKSPSYYI